MIRLRQIRAIVAAYDAEFGAGAASLDALAWSVVGLAFFLVAACLVAIAGGGHG